MSIEVLSFCEVVVEEFWRAGEEATVKRLKSGILQKVGGSIEGREINEQVVGVWRRMWVLDRDSEHKNGKDCLHLSS